jgi:hypothetical protein
MELTLDRLILLHKWLMNNYFITLDDRVWRQQTGIPMGFSCSPIWCNMYLLSYETKFIQRLACLGRQDLMTKFQHAFRYIDDLCLFNVMNPREFLSPVQLRTEQNPFWIYPLDVLEIKEETSKFSQLYPKRGIQAHFMNYEFQVNELTPHEFNFSKFNKQRNLSFPYIQYIKYRSNRSVHQSYNIAISQVLSILYISSTDLAAFEEIRILINTLTSNGFHEPRLIKVITRFLLKGPFPGSRVDVQRIVATLST